MSDARRLSQIRPRTLPRRGPQEIPTHLWRNAPYRSWLHRHGRCIVCGAPDCDPMHGPPAGKSMKGPDAGPDGCTPGCRSHHDEQSRIGWPAFEKKHRISRRREARRWWQRYQEAAAAS
jgi:hypothetical protein